MPTRAWCTRCKGTAGNVNDVVEANTLLHGDETKPGATPATRAHKRPDAKDGVRWNIAMRPGKRKRWTRAETGRDLTDQIERLKASIRAKVEHPFRVIKRQFGHVKVRYRGLKKNTAQLHHAVRAVQPVDGGSRGMSAPKTARRA
jgi:IS5 family transposase